MSQPITTLMSPRARSLREIRWPDRRGGARFWQVEVVPVLDLKDGAVVHARMGRRSKYRPIETPLSSTSKPVDVTRGLLSIYPFQTFYIADLDAIDRNGDNNEALTELREEFPDITFWVDSGVTDWPSAQGWLNADLGHLVLGSETQEDGCCASRAFYRRSDHTVPRLQGRRVCRTTSVAEQRRCLATSHNSHDARAGRQHDGPRLE